MARTNEQKIQFEHVTQQLIDINRGMEFDKNWAEGYVTGLHAARAFDDLVYDDLIDWIVQMTPDQQDNLE